jgi:hypothetical protein
MVSAMKRERPGALACTGFVRHVHHVQPRTCRQDSTGFWQKHVRGKKIKPKHLFALHLFATAALLSGASGSATERPN